MVKEIGVEPMTHCFSNNCSTKYVCFARWGAVFIFLYYIFEKNSISHKLLKRFTKHSTTELQSHFIIDDVSCCWLAVYCYVNRLQEGNKDAPFFILVELVGIEPTTSRLKVEKVCML